MTKTIRSYSNPQTRYFLHINDETGLADDCQCPDCQIRHRQCKHQRDFNQEVCKAERFAALFKKYDVRANGELATRRCYYELSLGY